MRLVKILWSVLFFIVVSYSATAQSTAWSDEAENGILSGVAEITENCINASGGQFVRLGDEVGNTLKFNNIDVSISGAYRLKLFYFHTGTQPIEVLVNGVSVGVKYFPASVWCYQGDAAEYLLEINLNSGINTLELRPVDGESAPFIDKLEITENTPKKINIDVSTSRILPGESADIIVTASDILLSPATIDLAVSGIASDLFEIDENTLQIPVGEMSASTTLSITDNFSSFETSLVLTINLSNLSGNIEMGETISANIKVTDQATTFYVSSSDGNDTNDGLSEATPWKTLEKIKTIYFVPNDQILFKSGDIFVGQLTFRGSGSEGKPILISSYGEGAKPIIDGANDADGAYVTAVLIENQEYIKITNLEISNDRRVSRKGEDDKQGYGILVYNSSNDIMNHFHFDNLTIREVYAVTIEGVDFNSVKVAGILFKSDKNTIVGKEKSIRDVLVENCYITRIGKFGIWCQHGGGDTGVGNDSTNRNKNLIFRNNHTFETGGSGMQPGRSYNCLIENNIFEYPGSGIDSRMTNRGSGAWFWSCRNVIAQYNTSLHVRGHGDSYGMHIDFGNENVILQYNYSEDSEGGFVEILGDNINSVYRFNVSVNDGIRDNKGNTLWVSDYSSSDTPSDNNYIYNNSVYVSGSLTPDISIKGMNTFIYNNAFFVTDDAAIGQTTVVEPAVGGEVKMSNNLFYGDIKSQLISIDTSPVFGNPLYIGAGELSVDGYKLNIGSAALNAGKTFDEPVFPQAGHGIFKDISPVADKDIFGNPISLSTQKSHIGAYNGIPLDVLDVKSRLLPKENEIFVYPNPASRVLNVVINSTATKTLQISLIDMSGRTVFADTPIITTGRNEIQYNIENKFESGIYMLNIINGNHFTFKRILLI